MVCDTSLLRAVMICPTTKGTKKALAQARCRGEEQKEE
jgi:hypothetical protein